MSINPEALDEYREILGDEFGPFFIDLIDTFFESGPEFIQTMKEALESGNTELFTRSAHTMKSNCKTFGAMEFSEKAFELEKLGDSGSLDGAMEKVLALEKDYELLVVELKELRDNLSG